MVGLDNLRDNYAVLLLDVDGTILRRARCAAGQPWRGDWHRGLRERHPGVRRVRRRRRHGGQPLHGAGAASLVVGDLAHDGAAEALYRTRHLWQ